jgi:Mce-associated membrane protein
VSDNVRDVDLTHEDDTDDSETTIIDPVDEHFHDDPHYGVEFVDYGVDDDATVIVDSHEAETVAETAKPKRNWRRDIWQRQVSVKPIPVALIVLLLISGGVTIWLYFHYHVPDQETNPGVARAAINAASEGTVALLSYSPDSLDKDFATARSHLSGDFLSYYDQFTEQIVAPAAKQKALKTSAHVMRAAVVELHSSSAVVLVFVDQSTTSKDSPDATTATSSVMVNLSLVDGKWLITKVTPV